MQVPDETRTTVLTDRLYRPRHVFRRLLYLPRTPIEQEATHQIHLIIQRTVRRRVQTRPVRMPPGYNVRDERALVQPARRERDAHLPIPHEPRPGSVAVPEGKHPRAQRPPLDVVRRAVVRARGEVVPARPGLHIRPQSTLLMLLSLISGVRLVRHFATRG